MNVTKLEVIQISEDVITTSVTGICPHYNAPKNSEHSNANHAYVYYEGIYYYKYSNSDNIFISCGNEYNGIFLGNGWYYWSGSSWMTCDCEPELHPTDD